MADTQNTVDIRGDCPRHIVDVIDAISLARRQKNRFELIVEILEDWYQQQMREVVAVQRVTMGNDERGAGR